MNARKRHWLISVWLCLVLMSCLATPTVTGTRIPMTTPDDHVSASNGDAQSTAPFTGFLPIVQKPLSVISPENVDQLTTIAALGKGTLSDLAWSPDGQRLAATSGRGVYLYDRALQETLLVERIRMRSAFSLDGRALATSSESGTAIEMWDMTLGRVTQTITDTGGIARFAWDKQQHVVSVSNRQIIRVWDANGGQAVRSLDVISPTLQDRHSAYLEDFTVSPDGKLAAWSVTWFSIRTFAEMYLLDMETGQIVDSVGDLYPYQSLTFSPDSTLLADIGGGAAQTVSVHDVADKSLRPVDATGAGTGVTDIAFTPDSANLVLAAYDGVAYQWDDSGVYMWNRATGVRTRLYDSDNRIAHVALSPDGLIVAAGIGDGTIRLVDTASGMEQAVLDGYGEAHTIAFSPNDPLLATPAGKTVLLWNLGNGQMSRPFNRQTPNGILRLGFSRDGDVLAIKSVIAPLYLWDITSGNELFTVDEVISFAFSPDSRLLALGLTEGRVQLWDIARRQMLYTVTQRPNVADLAFSPNGHMLALAGGWDNHDNVVLLEVASGREVRAYGRHEYGVCCIAFTPDGKIIATAGIDGVRLWDATGGQELRFFSGIVSTGIAFSPSGNLLAATTESQGVHLWDVPGLAEVRVIADEAGSLSVAFSPDGALLAVGARSGAVQLWGIQ